MAKGRVLIVEDRDSLRKLWRVTLESEGYRVDDAADGDAGVRLATEASYDLVLTDLQLPGASGLEVLAASREAQPQRPVIVLTGYGTVARAVEAMKLGAFDFLEKPVEIDDLLRLIAAAIGDSSTTGVFQPPGAPAIVGKHPRLRAALRLLQRVAGTDSTVLLTGESGTGKELFARALHALSPRSAGPFVALNCAAIPESLMENELFGHEKGAFTGADRRQLGRFESAATGTLFLDEIGELSLGVQGKVLRVLEERTYERVGGSQTLHADVRLVAATNRPLRRMVEEGTFRGDLFFRLEVFPIELPPLRERASDIPLLAHHLLRGIAERTGVDSARLTPDAEQLLAEQTWPGNVRELANLLERAAIVANRPQLRAADLRPLLQPTSSDPEPDQLRQALLTTGGDKTEAARLLGISYSTLQRRVKRHDLEGFPKYRR